MSTGSVDLDAALARRNPHPIALGNIRRVRIMGATFYLSPDICIWIVPTGITIALVIGCLLMTRDVTPAWEIAGCMGLVLTGLLSSLAVTMTDPGIYPRLAPGEVDPLEGAGHGFTMCRACNIRRPPRTAHCYVCNVCVLEHDHHCGVIGGCVGQRSLRWFTLFLVTISSASAWGMFWLFMDVTGYRPHGAAQSTLSSSGADSTLLIPADLKEGANGALAAEALRKEAAKRAAAGSSRSRRKAEHSAESISTAIDIMLMVFILNIVLIVGGLALYYVYLLFKDTTRREAQGKMFRPTGAPHLGWFGTLRRTCFPPPSMLEMPTVDGGLGSASRNQGGIV